MMSAYMSSQNISKLSSLSSYVLNNTRTHRVYDALFCDIWGVIHNGIDASQSTVDALIQFREAGGSVVLVSNAPRCHIAVENYLEHLHIPRSAFDAIVTSGDVTAKEISSRQGQEVYYLGPQKDHGLLLDLNLSPSPLESAHYILCTGLEDDTCETPKDYEPLLEKMALQNLPMICANPDRVVRRGETLVYCAGALAEVYNALGGNVLYTGKPYALIYDASLHVLENIRGESVPHHRILAIGDSIETDIHGARNMNLDSVFVSSGIHTPDLHHLDEEGQKLWIRKHIGTHPENTPRFAFMSHISW